MQCKGIFISIWGQDFGSSTQEFVTYTCFDDDTSIFPQIFCLINCFLCLLIFCAYHFKQREHLFDWGLHALNWFFTAHVTLGLGFPAFKFQYPTGSFVSFFLWFTYRFLNVFSLHSFLKRTILQEQKPWFWHKI